MDASTFTANTLFDDTVGMAVDMLNQLNRSVYKVSNLFCAPFCCPLQVSAHVQFDIARVRMLSNMLGFLFDGQSSPERIELLRLVDEELEGLRSQYFTMLYGGTMVTSTVRATAAPGPAYCTYQTKSRQHMAQRQQHGICRLVAACIWHWLPHSSGQQDDRMRAGCPSRAQSCAMGLEPVLWDGYAHITPVMFACVSMHVAGGDCDCIISAVQGHDYFKPFLQHQRMLAK
jgi:hypothetical protein